MTDDERALLKEWNERLKQEGLAMSRGLPPKSITLVQFIEDLHHETLADYE